MFDKAQIKCPCPGILLHVAWGESPPEHQKPVAVCPRPNHQSQISKDPFSSQYHPKEGCWHLCAAEEHLSVPELQLYRVGRGELGEGLMSLLHITTCPLLPSTCWIVIE